MGSNDETELESFVVQTTDTEQELNRVAGGDGSLRGMDGCYSRSTGYRICTVILVVGLVTRASFHLVPSKHTKQHLPDTPFDSTCMSAFTTATSWTEFVHRTASVRPLSARCDTNATLCTCLNPFEPQPRNVSFASWPMALARNLALIANATTHNTVYDVVLLGDSITEHWLGTNIAIPQDYLVDIPAVYHELFDGPPTSPVHGLALGIGGDMTNHLFYRLLHGEVQAPAKVYWILIGINDFLRGPCRTDLILAGIVQSVETLVAKPPTVGGDDDTPSTIVVSSILPWGSESLDIHTNIHWRTVRTLNHALECYTHRRRDKTAPRRVEFFNATEYFLTEDKLHVNATYMAPDMLHPSAAGRRVWGAAMVQRVQTIVHQT